MATTDEIYAFGDNRGRISTGDNRHVYARALESREKQCSSSLDRNPSGDQQKPVRKEQKSGTKGRSSEGNLKDQSQGSQQSSPSLWRSNREVRKCYKCQEVGHIARNCPHSVEAPGRRLNASMTSSTNTVGSIQPVVPDEVTDEQLEQILREAPTYA